MISYQAFAVAISVADIVMYVALLLIAFRRASFRHRLPLRFTETVASHARRIEGPMLTGMLLAALATTIAAFLIGSAAVYEQWAAFTIAAVRGGLFVLGLWLLAWYWRERITWMGR